jgi:hypothetical protein
VTDTGPVFLRWRQGRPAPTIERFETLDAALDAIEARWEMLQHLAPQILDKRRLLLASTDDIRTMIEAKEE